MGGQMRKWNTLNKRLNLSRNSRRTDFKAPRTARKYRADKLYQRQKTNEIGAIMNDREKCLREACEIVNGARNQTYGNVEDNFQKIANLWSCYLGYGVGPIDVAMMMVLLKVARVSTGTTHLDNFVDVAGYAACAYEMGNDLDWEGESNGSNRENLVRAN